MKEFLNEKLNEICVSEADIKTVPRCKCSFLRSLETSASSLALHSNQFTNSAPLLLHYRLQLL